MVSSWSRLPAAEHRAFGRRSLVSSTKQLVMREAGASAGPGCGVSPQPVHRLAAECGLTLRSSGPPPAWRLAREAMQGIIRLAGQAPRRRCPLSSNVRPHGNARIVFVTAFALARAAECKNPRQPRLAGQSKPSSVSGIRKTAGSVAPNAGRASRNLSSGVGSLLNSVSPWSRLAAAELRGFGLRSLVRSPKRSVLRMAGASAWQCHGVFASAGASLGGAVRPNPSLERTSTGLALGPRASHAYHPSRGPSANPAVSAQLKR